MQLNFWGKIDSEFPVASCFMCDKAPVTAAMHGDMIIRPLCSTGYSVEATYNASWGWGG